jgi:quinol monooxygenase YgiN
MLMRMVRVQVRPDAIAPFEGFYAGTILPALEQVEGCLYAALVQSVASEQDGLSVTLWENRRSLEAYVASGKFEELIRLSRPFFADGEEWKLRIGSEGQVEYVPLPQEPEVRSYAQASVGSTPPAARAVTPAYLRMVTIPVRRERAEEFQRIYQDEVHPLLAATRGCRSVFMAENIERAGEWVCITVWDRKEDADRYDEEGGFARTREKLGRALSDLFQWKIAMDRTLGRKAVTSEDMSVRGYRLIVAKSFGARREAR